MEEADAKAHAAGSKAVEVSEVKDKARITLSKLAKRSTPSWLKLG